MQIDRFNGNDKNHDILGYVDKDVETYYHTYEYNSGKDGAAIRITHTIGTEDIYPDMYQDSK